MQIKSFKICNAKLIMNGKTRKIDLFCLQIEEINNKNKENIVLWEDFLIYAVVLEENETIINDIYSYRNINLNILNNIKRVIDVIKM